MRNYYHKTKLIYFTIRKSISFVLFAYKLALRKNYFSEAGEMGENDNSNI